MDKAQGPNDSFFELLAETARTDPVSVQAPSRLKSKIYSLLTNRMEESGPLLNLDKTRSIHGLCVFEGLVDIGHLPAKVKTANICRVCHARVLAERIERAPIYWGNCPYVGFQNR